MDQVKKKRGRKPKTTQGEIEEVSSSIVEKKKRGRKKKYEIENFEKILNRNEVNNFDHKVAYSDDENPETEDIVKKVSFGNLDITVSKKVSAPAETYKNYIQKKSIINENEWGSDEEKEIPVENILQENFEKYYKQNKKYIPGNASDISIKKNEDSLKRMRVVTCVKNTFNADDSWPENTDICCWWCCHTFTNCPCTLPTKYDPLRKRFSFTGIFCSWNCTKAYNFERNDHSMYNRSQLITLLIQQMYGLTNAINIKASPPRQCLKMFGGYMTIEQFRDNTTHVDSYKLNLIKHNFIYPEITEISNIKIKTAHKNLRLSRNT